MPETTRFYEWDVDDRLKQVGQSGHSGSWDSEYTHDALGNLQSAKHWTAKGTEFERRMPDEVGNLFRTEDRNDRQYGPAGELLSAAGKDGVTTYEYDAEGNLSKKTEPNGREWTYEWNMAGMLVKVVRPDGCVVEFGYDALGRRVWKKFRGAPDEVGVGRQQSAPRVGGGSRGRHPSRLRTKGRRSRKSGQTGAVAGDAAGSAQPRSWGRRTRPSPGTSSRRASRLWGRWWLARAYGIVTDHLGTPSGCTTRRAGKSGARSSGIYGHLRRLKGPRQLCPFRWPGQYEDVETGLYYNRFRYYDPVAGAYVSQDPIRPCWGWRLHAYPKDPLRAIDPFGLTATSGCGPGGLRPGDLSRTMRSSGDG